MRHPFLGALFGLALAGCHCGSEPGAPADRPPSADGDNTLKLIVLISIDQLPSWTFTRDAGQLTGGLGRLLRESVYFPEVELPYANSYTAPGHAALATGAAPDRTGIMANGWFRERGGVYAAATADPTKPTYDLSVGAAAGTVTIEGASPMMLRAEGVSDVLGRATPDARSVSLGFKQRAVILMLGSRVTRAVWYEDRQAAMTTSEYYGEPPPWLTSFNRSSPISALYDSVWSIEDKDFLRRYTGVTDVSIGEGNSAALGFDQGFPHTASGSKLAAKAVRSMPGAVDYTINVARAAIDGEQLGLRGTRDLLGLTISTHDYVGHFWGQESWERFDILRQIDRSLAQLFGYLDETIGANHYAVILTSDHGAVPLIERSAAQGRDARRIPLSDLAEATNRGLESVLGKGRWTGGYAANSIYTSPLFASQPKARREAALEAAAAELSKVVGVGFAAPTARIAGDCARHAEQMARLLCRTIHVEEMGDLVVVPNRFSLFSPPQYPTGTGHGTPSEECRKVPVLVRIPGTPAITSTARVNLLQVAPTLAKLLEIDPPRDAIEPPLPLTDSEHPDGNVP